MSIGYLRLICDLIVHDFQHQSLTQSIMMLSSGNRTISPVILSVVNSLIAVWCKANDIGVFSAYVFRPPDVHRRPSSLLMKLLHRTFELSGSGAAAHQKFG